MGAKRTAWHWFFGTLLRRRGPNDLEVRDEVPLSDEPPRVDYLLLRGPAPSQPSGPAQSLRGLWPLLSLVAIVEFKSLSRPYRAGNLDRLWSYLHGYYAGARAELPRRDDLRGVLVVPARSPGLEADVDAMRLARKDLGGGYWQLEGGAFPLYVVDIDVVAEKERDGVLGLFGHGTTEPSLEARRFWAEQVGATEAGMEPQDLEGYEDVLRRLVEVFPRKHILALYTPKERLEDLSPKERLEDLAPEEALLALPDEVLRGFSDEYLATLSEPTRAAIRRRIGR